jgi:hypothetical protein
MKLARLNLLSALICTIASWFWFALGEVLAGSTWLACSLVWLFLAITRRYQPATEPHPRHRLARRLSRLLLWS